MKAFMRPDDEDKPFVARWNLLVRILLIESSVKLVARTAMDYADFHDGSGVFPSDERLARETGYSTKTVGMTWKVMTALGLAVLVGDAVPHKGIANEYDLHIPERWRSLPILGPHARDFHCLHCKKKFAPSSSALVVRKDGSCGWHVDQLVFCPRPRQTKGRAGTWCGAAWDYDEKTAGRKVWRDLGDEVWEHFREARGDDWRDTSTKS